MTAESFRPKFSTSASGQEERREEREKLGHYFGSRVTTREGKTPPTNVRPAPCKFEAVNDAIAFKEAQAATKHEIQQNEVLLQRAEQRQAKRWKKGKGKGKPDDAT